MAQLAAAAQAKAHASRGRGGTKRGGSAGRAVGRGPWSRREERGFQPKEECDQGALGRTQQHEKAWQVAHSLVETQSRWRSLRLAPQQRTKRLCKRGSTLDMNPHEPLSGSLMKAPLYQARRALLSLSELNLKDTVEFSNLKARMQLIEQCIKTLR